MRATLPALLSPVLLAGAVVAAPVPKQSGPPPVTEEHLKASRENLKEIVLAVHNYHDANGWMPTDIRDKDGKPLLSWRVQLLPYFEQDHIYRQFKLDEPWDSEHNKKLAEKMPKLFAPVRVRVPAGMTYYQVFSGEGALFSPKQKPRGLATITDGLSNTALVFEAGEPVIWTKPADLPYDAKKPLPRLGGLFDGEFHVALCDGSVMRVKKDFDPAEMRRFITPADGEVIDLDKLKK